MQTATHDTIAAVWRIESARVVAKVARMVRDVGVAEELAQDALVAALETWPAGGAPLNPAAWLMATAKRRAIDHIRRARADAENVDAIAADLVAQEAHVVPDFSDSLEVDGGIEDDMLRLVFTACHPVLSTEARVALTLKLVAGLTTREIARAQLVPEATVAQRIVRAKRTLSEAGAAFELPAPEMLGRRLASVLEVVYLVFNEGYTATSGEDWMRPALCGEALRLARMLAGLAPQEAEAHGLAALLELQSSRFAARTDASGEPVLLLNQDRRRWDRLLIRRGLDALQRAISLESQPGPYRLQASIAACHARATTASETDWAAIAAIYGQLAEVTPSPVVELNRAVAVSMAEGPAAGLAIVDRIAHDKSLQKYQWLPGVRGDLLAKLGRRDEARVEFERAARLATNDRERALMLRRASDASAGK